MLRFTALLLVACSFRSLPEDTASDQKDSYNGYDGPIDADGDGYEGPMDCDDGDPMVNLSATEICGDGIDNNCDGLVDDASATDAVTGFWDGDGDGYGIDSDTTTGCELPEGYVSTIGDCNDTNPNVHPGATELCNNADEDCDGIYDEGAADLANWYLDGDEDGYGDPATAESACDAPAGYVKDGTDCDDTDPAISPAALEICDADDVDEDCSGLADDDDPGLSDASAWYPDNDSDNYGAMTAWYGCEAPVGYLAISGDCDDNDPALNPETVWYYDGDGDGAGSSATATGCTAPAGYVADATDCDDSRADVSPSAVEVCDGATDEDCDGLVDDADDAPTDTTTFYADADADGYGDSAVSQDRCAQPASYVADATDCDDARADVNPAGTEVCDVLNADEDCDGLVNDADVVEDDITLYRDDDGDGYGIDADVLSACGAVEGYADLSGDCADADPAINPGEDEVCDGVDNDCDSLIDADDDSTVDVLLLYADSDADGYGPDGEPLRSCDPITGYAEADGDCDDADASLNPGMEELCDEAGIDEDCDGLANNADDAVADGDWWYPDADGDGFGATEGRTACSQLDGYLADNSDCDDGDAAISPVGTETCDADNADEDCDGAADDADAGGATATTPFQPDADADGYGSSSTSEDFCDQPAGYTTDASDCDDANASISPAAAEVCDGVDQDCDGVIDDGMNLYYADGDSDGYGGGSGACTDPGGWTLTGGDCDDGDDAISPAATEICNSLDDDCDGLTDDDDDSLEGDVWYADADADGYGDPDSTTDACTAPTGYTDDDQDCDDSDSTVNPDGTEVYGDEVDDDCDGALRPTFDCTGVSVPGDYPTIADALSALGNTTATICLGEGTYEEGITFSGSGNITLLGVSADHTVISGTVNLLPNGGDITLQGLTVANQVYVSDYNASASQNVYLYDMRIEPRAAHGLYIYRDSNGSIDVYADSVEVAVASSWYGVYVFDLYGTDGSFDIDLDNMYVHGGATCVYADFQAGHYYSYFDMDNGTLVDCDVGAYVYSYHSYITAKIRNTVFYGMTSYGLYDAIDDHGAFNPSYNALYANAANYGGTATDGVGYVTADPLLDFNYSPPQPMAGSPLINAGTTSSVPTADYWGKTRSSTDMGCVEY